MSFVVIVVVVVVTSYTLDMVNECDQKINALLLEREKLIFQLEASYLINNNMSYLNVVYL